MSVTNDLIKEIKSGLSQTASSSKDEIRVMQSMLNDKEFSVDVYSGNGVVESYCPSADARKLISSVITSSVKLSKDEADKIASGHEFSKTEAVSLIGVSKQFVNTYLETGRKLPLGGRSDSNIALTSKTVPEKASKIPKKTGIDANGNDIYESVATGKIIPAHNTIKVNGSCPKWIKE